MSRNHQQQFELGESFKGDSVMREKACIARFKSSLQKALKKLLKLWPIFALALSTQLGATDIQHIYDPAGRLIQSAVPNSTSVYYTYDAVGNLIATKQYAASSLTILGFTPTSGLAGALVTINGSGFNPTTIGNTVSFNGITAVVLTASAAALNVIVPIGATSGPISVSNTNGTVTSTTPFIIGNALISGGTPEAVNLAANASTSFTFAGNQGQGYALGLTGVVGNLTVTVTKPDNTNLVTCSSITSTTSCVLPYLPTTGSYTVTLKAGTSAANLSISLNADVGGALMDNVSSTFVADKVGQAGTYTFNAAVDLLGRLSITGDTIPGSSTIQLYRPDGVLYQSKTISASSGVDGMATLELTGVPMGGLYKARLIPPAGNATGSMVIRFVRDEQNSLTAGDTQSDTLQPNQNANFTFTGTVGQWLGVGFANLNITPSNGNLSVIVYKPDGSSLTSYTVNGTSAGFVLPKLPVAGTYKILVQAGNNAANFDLLLTEDLSGALVPNGSPQTFAPSRVGQAASYTFDATAGQTVGLSMAGSTFVGYTYVYIYKPDGSQLASMYANYTSGTGASSQVTLANLAVTGTYTVRVVPPSGKLGTVAVSLAGESDITAGATEKPVNQNGVVGFSFAGSAGQRLGIGFANLNIAPSNGNLSVTVYKPDGSSLTSYTVNGTSAGFVLPILPVSGTYQILIQPGNNTATYDLLLTEDASGALTPNGTPQAFTPSRVGQAASYTFDATAGQTVGLSVAGDTFVGYTYVYIYKPDGTQQTVVSVNYTSGTGASSQMTLANLAVSGTYTVRVVPPSGKLGTVAVSLAGTEAITDGDAARSVEQNGAKGFTFAGSAGQRLGIGFANLNITPSNGSMTAYIYKPDGSSLMNCAMSGVTAGCALPMLPISGTYQILIQPGNNTATYDLLLTEDASGVLTPNGAPQTFTPSRVGQAASYTFDGTAGQNVNLQITGVTFLGNTSLYVYKPDGTQLNVTSINYSSGTGSSTVITLNNLPTTGTYTARAVPPSGKLGSINVALRTEDGGAVTSGTDTAVDLLAGQNAAYTFTGVAGQWLGVGFANLNITPSNGNLSVIVYKPDGSSLTSYTMNGTSAGFVLPRLPVAGTYNILVKAGNNAASFDMLLSEDETGELAPNGGSQAFTLTRIEQMVDISVDAIKGLSGTLSVFGATSPTHIYVYNSDGTLLNSCTVNGTDNKCGLPSSESEMYQVISQPRIDNISFSVLYLGPPPIAPGSKDAQAPVSAAVGYSFEATEGKTISLSISGMTSPGNTYIYVYNPDGSMLTSCTVSGEAGNCAFPTLLTSGTYQIAIFQGDNSASLNLQLTENSGGVQTFAPTRVGQAASYTFNAAAGQTVGLSMAGSTFVGYTYVYIYKPDGTQLTSTSVYSSGAAGTGQVTLANLAVSGTYTVRIVPPSGKLGAVTVGLSGNEAATVGDAAKPVNQQGAVGFSFAGSVGQRLGIGFTNLNITPSNGNLSVTVYKPDGTSLTSCTVSGTAGGCALPILPTSGTYQIIVQPGNNTATYDLLLTEDALGTLESNGTPQTFAPTRIGQAASYTFNAAAGQTVGLSMAGSTFVGYTYVYIYKPDGTQLTSTSVYSSGAAGTGQVTLANLAVSGTYTVRIVPPSGKLGAVTVGLSGNEAATVGDAAKPVNQQGAVGFSFAGSAGQRLGIGLANLNITPSNGSLTVYVYKPDGTSLTSCAMSGTAGGCALPILPTSGTYQIIVQPGNNTATYDLLLTEDASGTLDSNGTPQTFAPTRIGQAASYTFNAAAGQTVGLSMAGSTFVGYTYTYIYKPDGSQLNTMSAYYNNSGAGGTAQVTLTNLATSGTYTARVIPPNGKLGSVSVKMQ